MNESLFDLEALWERLLSRQAQQIQEAFASLNAAEQRAVILHLQRMASEKDWHPEQRLSAQAALDSIGEIRSRDDSQ